MKEERDGGSMINCSEHTKHILPFSCSNTIQDKTKARKAPIDEG